jgi:hypothetical protein
MPEQDDQSPVIEPTEQEAVPFHDQTIIAVRLPDDRICVVLRWICESLNLAPNKQISRIERTSSIANELVRVKVQTGGGKQAMAALTLRGFPVWILGINPNEIKDERRREMIIAYQVEAVDVLYNHFSKRRPALQETLVPTSSTLEQIRATGLAIAQLAEQQIQMEQREQHLTERLDKAAEIFTGFERRLGTLEKKLSPAAFITEEQAETISSTVKALAELIASKDPSKNHYQSIFSELYRRFGVSSYKNIRLDRYEKVLSFLEDWYQSVMQGTTESNLRSDRQSPSWPA